MNKTENYSKDVLLKKLKELLDQSNFISKDIYKYAQSLNNEKLEKLVIIIFNNLTNEKNMSEIDKKQLISKIKEFSDIQIEIIKKWKANFIQFAEENDKEKDNEDVSILINSIN